ncbi:hypothetical protein Q9966_013395, partial [Columba livia]
PAWRGGPWDTGLGSVVCRQLGCGVLEKVSGVPGLGTVVLRCAGTEESLARCNVSGTAPASTGSPEEVAVVCSDQLSLRLAGGSSRCAGRLEVLHNGTWGGVCANGTSPATAIAACRQLGCGGGGRLEPAPPGDTAPAWLAWVGCEKGTHWLWRCPSAPWRLQDCGPGGDAHVACDEDTDGTSGTPTPSPGVPSGTALTAAAESVPVSMVLCVVLGTLLFLALGALAVQMCCARARRRGGSWGRAGAADAVSDAVYEELDYTPDPEYQEVPSGSGSLSEGSGTKLPYYVGDGVEESDSKAAPESPAQHSSPDVYDDAAAVPEVSPAPSAGDMSEGVTRRSWGCPPPTGRAGAADAVSDAVYEELDYTPDPEYQEVPSGSGRAGAEDAVSDAVYEELDYTPDPEYQEVPSGSGVPSGTVLTASAESVPVSTVLCVVLGTLLFLALGALAVQMCCARARRRGRAGAADAVSDAVYEELDYTPDPEYQEVPSGSGSLSEGSGTKLPYYVGDGVEESDPKAAAGRDTGTAMWLGAPGRGDMARCWGHEGTQALLSQGSQLSCGCH